MAMVVYDPNKGSGKRRFLAALGALSFVAFVAAAVVAVAVFGISGSGDAPEGLAFREEAPEQLEAVEDETLEIELDEDGTADEFTVDSVEGPATAELEDTTLVIEPEQDATGSITVVVTACGEQECATRTIVAEVISRNDPPLAGLDEAELEGGEQVIRIPVLENDSDVDDTSLEIVDAAVVLGTGEVVIVEDGTVIEFSTGPEVVGPWEITYIVTDGDGGFDQGTVRIADTDGAPQAQDDEVAALVGERVRISPLENDADDGGRDQLRIVEVSDPVGATVEFGDDWIEFVAGSEPGEDAFTYVVRDAKGQTGEAVVSIAVTAPSLVLVDDQASTIEDTAVSVDVLANDGPIEAAIDPTTLTVISASSGTVAVGGGQISYDPPPDAAGEASIIYEVCSEFGECAQATARITVEGVADGSFSSDGEIRVPANAGPQLIPWLAVSSGEASPPAGARFSISTDDRSLFSDIPSIGNNGALIFTPRPGARGTSTTRITTTDSVNGQRVFEIRIIVT